MLHDVLGKNANGVPYDVLVSVQQSSHNRAQCGGGRLTQLSVLMDVPPFKTSLGMLPALRDQNQTLMNDVVRSIA